MFSSSPARIFQIEPVDTEERLEHVKAIVRTWQDAAAERLSISRHNKGSRGSPEFDNFLDDRGLFTDYNTVMGYLVSSIDEKRTQLRSPDRIEAPVEIASLADADDEVQGLAAMTIKVDHVYLDALASAPWNIRMHSPVPDGKMRFQGCGSALVGYACSVAHREHKLTLATTPFAGARSFYESLGMTWNVDQMWYEMPVTEEA